MTVVLTRPETIEPIQYGFRWVSVTFQNSWANFLAFGPGIYPLCSYTKTPDGRVHLRGRISGGASSTTAFTLPAEFRPAYEEDFGTTCDSTTAGVVTAATVAITPAGEVVVIYPGTLTSLWLGGLSFDTRR